MVRPYWGTNECVGGGDPRCTRVILITHPTAPNNPPVVFESGLVECAPVYILVRALVRVYFSYVYPGAYKGG